MKITPYLILLLLLSACNSKQQESDETETSSIEQSQTSQAETMPTKSKLNSQVALDFINAYVDNISGMNTEIEITEWVATSQLVTNKFKEELKNMISAAWKNDPEYGLGFDPIFDAQDFPDEGFEISAFDEATGYVTVVGKNWEDFTLNLRIVNKDGQTLVDGCGVINVPEEMRAER